MKMVKIQLSLDDYLIDKQDCIEIIDIIKKTTVDTDVYEGPMGEMGGISWFPRDLIILIIGMTAGGFFSAMGKDLYNKLKIKFKLLLSQFTSRESSISTAYLAYEINKLTLYFEFNRDILGYVDLAFDKLKSDYPQIEKEVIRLLEFKPQILTGSFSSITFIFDIIDKQWIIAHFNS